MTRRSYRFSRAVLWSLYWEHGLDIRQIAARLNIPNWSVVHRAMIRFGIERRGAQQYKEARACKHCGGIAVAGALCRQHLREYNREYGKKRRQRGKIRGAESIDGRSA